ncbi:hypothetical protein TELCIR_11962 [Teladorsagia circumcincta]|uniref:DH domain-containing protein n=1 Tax=Teladorsagia circumcincta TaxID=45464 RepID=A0A2G9U7S7_TELCI|nr:hypothetical protein TELCIR_11962 [Teladorsagia circumcincta]
MISIDALSKFIDPSQLIRDLGGSFPYDHDDWLDTRLMLDWTRKHCDALSRRIGDIGVNDTEASERLHEFEEFSTTADLERTKLRLEEEWARFQEQLMKRKLILSAAVAFFSASKVLLKSVDVDDAASKEQMGKLTRAHKHLLCQWKERRGKPSNKLARFREIIAIFDKLQGIRIRTPINFLKPVKQYWNQSWEEDMRGMLESSTFAGNAEKVLPFHQDNTAQVKMAVKNIRKCAQEVLQIRNVVREIVSVFDREERALQVMSTVPVDLEQALRAQEAHEMFIKRIELNNMDSVRVFYELSNELIREGSTDRSAVVELNEMVTGRWRRLSGCQQFVLMDATRHVLVDWLCGEGERRLSEFLGKGVADAATLEDFHTFKLAVKEERAKIQTLLCMAGPIRDEAKQHAADIADCMDDVRLRFEKFSRRVAECETLLRGGKPIPVYIAEFDSAEANSTLPSILKDRRQAIFGNYEKLYAFHSEKFFHELSKYEDDPEEVGCSFTVWVDYLNELYTDYCVNMEQNNHVVALPEVMSFFEV